MTMYLGKLKKFYKNITVFLIHKMLIQHKAITQKFPHIPKKNLDPYHFYY